MVLPLTDCFCVQKIRVLPNSLPNITLDNPYYAKININFRFVERHFSYQIEPENSGLLIIPLDSRSIAPYNDLRVKGIPKILGTMIIKLIGSTYGTMCPGNDFEKIYTIKIKE